MRTKPLSIEALKEILSEIFFNKTDKVTKITDETVINADFFGTARIAQKAMKEIAVIEANIFPQNAAESELDSAGMLFSSITRNTSSISSTYLLIIAEPGTVYNQATVVFTGSSGISFQLEENFTVDDNGFGYAKVRSTDAGASSNIDANTITFVSPEPVGHIAVTNEFKATGGRDVESDEDFRSRIQAHYNIIAKTTLSYLTEIFRNYNSDILLLQNLGYDEEGVLNIGIVTQNGISLTTNELNELLDNTKEYFSLSDLNKQGNVVGVKLVNTTYYIVGGDTTGVDFRVQLYANYSPDQVRKNIQIAMSQYLDPRNWLAEATVQWDTLLRIVQDTAGVRYVPDEWFLPNSDELVPVNEFPRIKRFVMRDLDGNILADNNGVLSPVFYPNN
jgi:hypothetical protein